MVNIIMIFEKDIYGEKMKKKYNSCNVKYLFNVVHDKYSVIYDKVKAYYHYFYE